MRNALARTYIIALKEFVATHAAVPFHVPMQWVYPLAACIAVQVIYVLSYYCIKLAPRFQPRKSIVCRVWLGIYQQDAFIVFIKHIGFCKISVHRPNSQP